MRAFRILAFPVLLIVFFLFITGCISPTDTVSSNTNTANEIAYSSAVLTAREAVLDFMREGAIISVPGKGAEWESGLGKSPTGYEVYTFTGNNCALTVSYPLEETEQTIYHVTLNSKDVGLCWQANVDAKGKIISTGLGAEMFPDLVKVSADFCQEHGFAYTENPKDEENQCGICTFSDGSTCNAWGYYQGLCQPGEYPADE